jgi:hypothetical protein
MGLAVRPLDGATWPDFAALVERHNGVWGGCWCMSFHAEGVGRDRTAERNRADKHRRVGEGTAHAALVYDAGECVGWCQFGPTGELPRIKRAAAYRAGLVDLPDWRITCFFVDRRWRHRGVTGTALDGALGLIGGLGGGVVESYPEDVGGRRVSASFLHNGTVGLFEAHGFTRTRPIGRHHWVVTTTVPPAAGAP